MGGHRQDQLFFSLCCHCSYTCAQHNCLFSEEFFSGHMNSQETSGSWHTVTFVDVEAQQFSKTQNLC